MPILGVDTGGTFTDFYLIADDSLSAGGGAAVTVYKRPSIPDDPAQAILKGLAEILPTSNLQPPATPDMGGTSTDVSLCPGRIIERDETHVGELPIRGPTVDVLSVGASGGAGITRTYEFLADATVTLLTERRWLAPCGLAGGSPGTPGRNTLFRAQAAGGAPRL